MLGKPSHSSWKELLGQPGAAAHVAQIYDCEEFLAQAVGHYAAEGLHAGEAVLLTGTQAHEARILQRLAGTGTDVDAAKRRGQLVVIDVEGALPALLSGETVDEERFREAVEGIFARARGAGFERLRWWGEMTHFLHSRGNRHAFRVEELAGELARARGVPVFCSFFMDRFDAQCYGSPLGELCRTHSHLIPAQDYVSHRRVVNRAVEEVVGALNGALLQSLMNWKGVCCDMPSSQAVLLWIRDTMPELLPEVLCRALQYEREPDAGQPA